MGKLVQLARKHNIKLTIAVYPWPAQIFHNDLNSRQVSFWKEFAAENKIGFLNYFPCFLNLNKDKPLKTLDEYYLERDMHWNEKGNRLVAEVFLKFYGKRDFNGDNVEDVLAIADGNQAGTGYKRAFLFNGTNGSIIWEHFYPGPNPAFGKTIISVNDFTGDNIPEVIIAYGNNGSSDQAVRALNGANGQAIWTREMIDYEPKELLALPLPGGGTDIIAAEYFSRIHRLDGTTGNISWTYPLGASAGVIQIGLIDDIDGDQIPDVLIASFAGIGFNCLSGGNGTQLWSYQMDYQFGVASIPDIDDDGYQDVIVGSRDEFLYCINGKGDSLIFKNQFSDWLYSVNRMPSIDGNYSYEVLAGTRDGIVAVLSGGIDFVVDAGSGEATEIPVEYSLLQNYPNPFNPSTKIEFKIPASGLVTLKVYDLLGREVTTLISEELQPGNYAVNFDAVSLSSGIYFYTLTAGDFVSTKKMILLK